MVNVSTAMYSHHPKFRHSRDHRAGSRGQIVDGIQLVSGQQPLKTVLCPGIGKAT